MNRRKVLGVLAGAALTPLASSMAEARTDEVEGYLTSSLDPREIEQHRSQAAEKLVNGIWSNSELKRFACEWYFGGLNDRRAIAQKLTTESTMFIPDSVACGAMIEQHRASITDLAAAIPDEGYGVFVDGNAQALHVLRSSKNKTQFLKAYRVSSSNEPWSNAPNSNGSPLGMHQIATGRIGLLGEVLSGKSGVGKSYAHIAVREHGGMHSRPFIRSFGEHQHSAAEIITAAFMLVGPQTPTSRGIFIHGTNYPELLGQRASGGCIRLSSVDVIDIAQYLKAGALRGPTSVEHGTPVMLAATQHVQDPNVPRPHRRNLFEEM